ncbi:MAG: copper resistance protein CopC [Rhodothermales bacterium]
MLKHITHLLAITLILVGQAFAHSPLKSTSPENNAKLDNIPEMLHLTFSKPARIVKVVMTHTNGDASHEMKLELPSKEITDEVHLTPEFMGAGEYTVDWRALSEDGHTIKGNFSFMVEGG